MTDWHSRCDDDPTCNWHCQRPGCHEPSVHFLARCRREGNRWVAYHTYDCATASVARLAIEQLRPGMAPSELAIARRIIGKMLDRLESVERTRVDDARTDAPPKEHTKPARPTPRELTHARTQHLEWLAQRKEKTA